MHLQFISLPGKIMMTVLPAPALAGLTDETVANDPRPAEDIMRFGYFDPESLDSLSLFTSAVIIARPLIISGKSRGNRTTKTHTFQVSDSFARRTHK